MSITTNYSNIYIFNKRTDLLRWFNIKYADKLNDENYTNSLGFNQLRQHYASPRDVQLVLLVRWEFDRCYCKIKCPINPLPVYGEFEAVSVSTIIRFLNDNGWILRDKFYAGIFK